ncbi:RNA polymerase sigma factor [Agrococcus terreus]|uniref:RNA polymerase sigma24 factor n=1 Tax=Agrococcus terreus TaxID=574649 RepID=A0ABQ2K9E1_9MICO|nr:sigma-70 family RNA polymerase sigma factor [Agrococcus terreus]GGN76770.1 RNA polymerase sigma24 factor [Agrococcus terreus]
MSPALDAAPDALLAQRAQDGDDRAFAVLVRRHSPFLVAFATRYMRSSSDADDVVQEALITAWRRLDELREPERVRSWLATAVARRATDVLRTRARRDVQPMPEVEQEDDRSPAPERVAEGRLATTALREALARLPEDQREVWLLREMAELSYDEIAERLGTSPATVRGRLSRARSAVLAAMEGWR